MVTMVTFCLMQCLYGMSIWRDLASGADGTYSPIINDCLPHDAPLIDGDARSDQPLDVERDGELDWLLQVDHDSVPARFHLRSNKDILVSFMSETHSKKNPSENPSGFFDI